MENRVHCIRGVMAPNQGRSTEVDSSPVGEATILRGLVITRYAQTREWVDVTHVGAASVRVLATVVVGVAVSFNEEPFLARAVDNCLLVSFLALAMRCQVSLQSVMQEIDPKQNISPRVKLIRLTKVMTMDLFRVDVIAATWRTNCRCLVPAMNYGVYHTVLLVVARLNVARWFVMNTIKHKDLDRFGPLRGIIPYALCTAWMSLLLICGYKCMRNRTINVLTIVYSLAVS